MTSIILVIIGVAIAEAIYKKVDIFDEFINGVKEGMQLVLTLFPRMMAFMLWVTCLQTCGITNILEQVLTPVFTFLQIPIDIVMMMLIRPFSSNGSMSIMSTVFTNYGVDHPYSLLASIIQTGSDTTFYVVTLYFGSIKLTKYRYALKLGLWLDFIACLLALICYHAFII
ncbi:MAG: spore maturation protein B [Coprobacillaceae bacterium]